MRHYVLAVACFLATVLFAGATAIRPKDTATPAATTATALSCAFPGSMLQFSLYRVKVTPNHTFKVPATSGAGASHMEEYSFPQAQNYNADSHPKSGVVFSSDVNGSINIYLHTPQGGAISQHLIGGPSASMYDHARWHPHGKSLVYMSTEEASGFNSVGWSAVYLRNLSSEGSPSMRLTPRGQPHADYSPSWSPDGKWVAVARGSGKAAVGRSNISIYNVERMEGPFQVAANGGWPTWSGNNTLIFHRLVGMAISGPWHLVSVNFTTIAHGGGVVPGAETTLVHGALTPYVAHTAPSDLVFAFIDPKGYRQIGMMNLESGARKQLTSESLHHWNPSYQPETSSVLFHKQHEGGITPNIRRYKSGSSILQDLAFVNGDFPSLSPGASKIAFTGGPGFKTIDVMSSDGSNRNVIYNETDTWMTSWVEGSGDRIAATRGGGFQPADDGNVQIMTVKSDGMGVKHLTHSPDQNQGYPCYSPNGTKIVYRTRARSDTSDSPFLGPYHLVIIDAEDGGNRRNLTLPLQITNHSLFHIGDTHPHWGPNNTIVFTSDRGHPGRPTIWTVKEDGSGMTEVFRQGSQGVHPSLTADGKHIVFTTVIAGWSAEQVTWPFAFVGDAELFTMTVDGEDLQRVTHDTSENANVWVGSQQLPASLTGDGTPNVQSYRDSTDPPGTHGKNRPHHQHQHEHDFETGKMQQMSRPPGAVVMGRPFPHGSVEVAEQQKKLLPDWALPILEERERAIEDNAVSQCPYLNGKG